jgi:hypothetical protein
MELSKWFSDFVPFFMVLLLLLLFDILGRKDVHTRCICFIVSKCYNGLFFFTRLFIWKRYYNTPQDIGNLRLQLNV